MVGQKLDKNSKMKLSPTSLLSKYELCLPIYIGDSRPSLSLEDGPLEHHVPVCIILLINCSLTNTVCHVLTGN